MRWEQAGRNTARAKVPGGWIVKHFEQYAMKPPAGIIGAQPKIGVNMAMCFIPDPEHEWTIVGVAGG